MISRTKLTRRIVIGVVALAVGAVVVVRELPLLRHRHYKRTTYDDLLQKLGDRDASAAFGRRVLSVAPTLKPAALGALLRERLRSEDLAAVSHRELSSAHVLEVSGWIVPETFALLCALAAHEA